MCNVILSSDECIAAILACAKLANMTFMDYTGMTEKRYREIRDADIALIERARQREKLSFAQRVHVMVRDAKAVIADPDVLYGTLDAIEHLCDEELARG